MYRDQTASKKRKVGKGEREREREILDKHQITT